MSADFVQADFDRDPRRPEPPDELTLDQSIERLRNRLAEPGQSPQNMSNQAIAVLVKRQAEYVEEIGSEAIKIAKRNRSDLVSAADIEVADQKLRGSSLSSQRALASTIGAAIFGAGLNEFISVMTTAHPGHLGIGLGCGGMVTGLLGIAYALARGR